MTQRGQTITAQIVAHDSRKVLDAKFWDRETLEAALMALLSETTIARVRGSGDKRWTYYRSVANDRSRDGAAIQAVRSNRIISETFRQAGLFHPREPQSCPQTT